MHGEPVHGRDPEARPAPAPPVTTRWSTPQTADPGAAGGRLPPFRPGSLFGPGREPSDDETGRPLERRGVAQDAPEPRDEVPIGSDEPFDSAEEEITLEEAWLIEDEALPSVPDPETPWIEPEQIPSYLLEGEPDTAIEADTTDLLAEPWTDAELTGVPGIEAIAAENDAAVELDIEALHEPEPLLHEAEPLEVHTADVDVAVEADILVAFGGAEDEPVAYTDDAADAHALDLPDAHALDLPDVEPPVVAAFGYDDSVHAPLPAGEWDRPTEEPFEAPDQEPDEWAGAVLDEPLIEPAVEPVGLVEDVLAWPEPDVAYSAELTEDSWESSEESAAIPAPDFDAEPTATHDPWTRSPAEIAAEEPWEHEPAREWSDLEPIPEAAGTLEDVDLEVLELAAEPATPANEEQPWDALGRALQEAITWTDLPSVEQPPAAAIWDTPQTEPEAAAQPGVEEEWAPVAEVVAEQEPEPAGAAPAALGTSDGFTLDVASKLESLADRLRQQGLGALGDAISRGDKLEASLALFLAGYRAGRDE